MSGRKNFLHKFQIVTSGDMSGNLTSTVVNIQGLDNIGIQFNVASGTPTGTLNIQVSADYDAINGNVISTGNWVNVTGATQAITSGSPTPVFFNLNQLPAQWVRLTYTSTSGTGTGNAFVTGKML